jgi:hypothetical protein
MLWASRDKACQTAANGTTQLICGNRPLLVRVMAQPGADTGQHLVQDLVIAVAVEADDEGVAEAALVLGVGGA